MFFGVLASQLVKIYDRLKYVDFHGTRSTRTGALFSFTFYLVLVASCMSYQGSWSTLLPAYYWLLLATLLLLQRVVLVWLA